MKRLWVYTLMGICLVRIAGQGTSIPFRIPKMLLPLKLSSKPPFTGRSVISPVTEKENPDSENDSVSASFTIWKSLSEKVLRTSQEEQAYHDLVSSLALLEHAEEVLMDTRFQQSLLEAQAIRMDWIDFLDDALAWKENPQKEKALAVLEDVVKRNISEMNINSQMKKSLVGDKIELFGLLEAVAPARAAEIRKSQEGTVDYRFLAYSHAMYRPKSTLEYE